MVIESFMSFNLAIIVLFLGKFLTYRSKFLQDFNIPEPVSGGLIVALATTAIFYIFNLEISFNLEMRDVLLIYFFTIIGVQSNFKSLVAGGKPLIILLAVTIGYVFLQNLTGTTVAKMMDLSPVVGIIGGSASLIGGHGTTIAWAPTFADQYGVASAMEMGIACATFGLILASLMGGPIARFLITRHKLEPAVVEQPDVGISHQDAHNETAMSIDYMVILKEWLFLNICITIGWGFFEALEEAGVKLPMFVCCLFAGIILTNVAPLVKKNLDKDSASRVKVRALFSDLSLGVFLAMSLMSLQLWNLIDLAGAIFFILIAQFIVAASFCLFIVFNVMGRDYEAAVVCSGFGGISLGATPTAIANMTAVTQKYGAAHKAFIIVPLVCAFFIDIVNTFAIKAFLPAM